MEHSINVSGGGGGDFQEGLNFLHYIKRFMRSAYHFCRIFEFKHIVVQRQ